MKKNWDPQLFIYVVSQLFSCFVAVCLVDMLGDGLFVCLVV